MNTTHIDALPEQLELPDEHAPEPEFDSPLLADADDPQRFFNYRPWAY